MWHVCPGEMPGESAAPSLHKGNMKLPWTFPLAMTKVNSNVISSSTDSEGTHDYILNDCVEEDEVI